MIKYAGIGSRATPPEIIEVMEDFAYAVASEAILRSGGASGADTAFEYGATLGGGQREIYLPWAGFNGIKHGHLDRATDAAMEIAAHYHPRWQYLKRGAKLLHGRNTHQILGKDLTDPVDFVVCWTKEAKGGGGTGQALRIAKDRGITIYDLADENALDDILAVIDGNGIIQESY